MKKNLHSHKLLFLFLVFILSVKNNTAQTPGLVITPAVQCLNSNGTTSAVAIVSPSVTGATSYSWVSLSSTSCPVIITSSSPNGSMVTLSYSCCGQHQFVCHAYNGAVHIGSLNITTTVSCPPVANINGNTSICFGSSSILSASGAQSYIWNVGSSGNSIVVSPTVSTYYVLTGTAANGCTDVDSAFVTVSNPPLPSFTSTFFPNGVVSFSNTSTNTLSSVSYTWNFGNSTFTSSVSPTITYFNNGVYTISLTADNNAGCSPVTATQVIQVSSASGTACAASYIYSISPNGTVSFSSTSTGTNASTNFLWNFGNGNSFNGTGTGGMTTSQTYSPGTFVVTLSISALPGCSSSVTGVVSITSSANCTLNANFTHAVNQNNTVNFLSTSTGTLSGSSYSWNYGDGSNGSGQASSHTYTNSGNYVVTLIVNNNSSPICISTRTAMVSICNLLADYTHTVTASGLVYFSSSTSTAYAGTNYYWNFGDGIFSTAANPTHAYNTGGTYSVTLYLNKNTGCSDSLTQSINITGVPCSANSNFNLSPTGTPNYWLATPAYPWNVTSAVWTWGDGTLDTSLYSSHIYSAAATYSICLSVTVSCGASSTFCYPHAISKSSDNSSSGIYFVNVYPPALQTGIIETNAEKNAYSIYPVPAENVLNIKANKDIPVEIVICDLLGNTVYTEQSELFNDKAKEIQLTNISGGIYFVRIRSGNSIVTQKIVVNK